ncbi:hypothetical protein GYB29_08140 [bacterium]|nr:hypothetical protein [bacterium]
MQSPTDGKVAIHHSAESGVMDIVSALIGVSDITTRNKPHKEPETIRKESLVHKLARASALRFCGRGI